MPAWSINLTGNTYRQYESERRGGPQPHSGGSSSDVPQSQGQSQSPSEPKSPRLAVDLAQSQSLKVVIPSSEVDMVEVRTTSPRSVHSSPSMSVSSAQPANVPSGVVPSIDWAGVAPPQGVASMADRVIDVIDAHWHPNRITPIYAQQGTIQAFIESYDHRRPRVKVRLLGGVAVYCDVELPPSQIYDPGWVNARGTHPKSIRPYQDLDKAAGILVGACAKANWAIGEVGLDYSGGLDEEHVAQRQFLACVVRLHRPPPLIIHLRGTIHDVLGVRPLQDLLSIFNSEGLGIYTRVQLHCFTGGPAEVDLATQSGYIIYFSLSGSILSADPVQLAGIRAIPANRILVETDSPYFPVGVDYGQMSPFHIGCIYARLADIRGVPVEELCARVSRNFRDIFHGYIM